MSYSLAFSRLLFKSLSQKKKTFIGRKRMEIIKMRVKVEFLGTGICEMVEMCCKITHSISIMRRSRKIMCEFEK